MTVYNHNMYLSLYDMILGAGVVFVIYATIKNALKTKHFKDFKTTVGECYEARSTRYNLIACTTRYFYTYTVNGVSYTGEDSEGSLFRYKHKYLKNPVSVEYLEDSPEVSRLAIVNHNNILRTVIYTLIVIAAYIYYVLRKNRML